MSSGRILSYLLVSIALRCALLPGQSAPVADDAVINQTGAGFPETWGENGGQKVPAYYTLKTDSPEKVAAGLRALPRISLSMDLDDLFGADKGIYAHPMETGTNWERRASMEMTYPGNGPSFKIDCGIRIQGGWNRRPEESPKHSFRVIFRKHYGAGKLKFALFDGGEPRVFDELILRAGCNNTWLHWSGEERERGDYIRDQWMRDSYRAMGHPSARGQFVHLYLNGLYWGLYNLTERPGKDFAAAHFGGKPNDYDARNGEKVLSGDTKAWDKLFSLANDGLTNSARLREALELLDPTAFADFMILNFYGGNADWDRASNWYAARSHSPPGKYYFFVWDGERTLEKIDANSISADDDQSPTRLFHKLIENENFKKLFVERARLHLTGNGALTAKPALDRYEYWSKRLEAAIACEAARWGAYRHDIHPYKTGPYEIYTKEKHWAREIERLHKAYFPKRAPVALQQIEEISR